MAIENENSELAISLSKPRKVTWFKDSCPVVETEKCQIVVEEEGLNHVLRFVGTRLEDQGLYEAVVDDLDYGTLKSSSTLTVKGKLDKILMKSRNIFLSLSLIFFFFVFVGHFVCKAPSLQK